MNQKLFELQNLEERVSNLYNRVMGYKSNVSDPTTSFANQINPSAMNPEDHQQNQIQIAPAQIEFYDENWRDVFQYLHDPDKIKSYKAFVDNFSKQLLSKADICELPEKADRQYVDYLLREISFESKKLLDEKLNSEFSGIKDQLEQSRADVTTMKIHFNAQIESLKKELIHFKRKLIDPTIDDEPALVQERHMNHHNKQAHTIQATSFLPRIQRPHIYKDTYRKRTRPYVPQDLRPIIISDNFIPE